LHPSDVRRRAGNDTPAFSASGISKPQHRNETGKGRVTELKARGAPTVSVTVTDASKGYWDKLGFEQIPVFLMLKTKI
jgi:hypothetical protein